MRIGIMGGTFNPVHIGHLIMAQTAMEEFGLAKVLFIPCASPPHKRPEDLAGAQARLRMLKKALAGNPDFEASDVEIRRGGKKSYSYDTLCELRVKARPKDEFFFVIGTDSLDQILTWHRIRDLMKLCRFIVVERPETKKAGEILKKMSARDRKFFGTFVLKHFPVGVSSRQIRQRVRQGLPIRYLVTEPVAAFIAKTGLYGKGN